MNRYMVTGYKIGSSSITKAKLEAISKLGDLAQEDILHDEVLSIVFKLYRSYSGPFRPPEILNDVYDELSHLLYAQALRISSLVYLSRLDPEDRDGYITIAYRSNERLSDRLFNEFEGMSLEQLKNEVLFIHHLIDIEKMNLYDVIENFYARNDDIKLN